MRLNAFLFPFQSLRAEWYQVSSSWCLHLLQEAATHVSQVIASSLQCLLWKTIITNTDLPQFSRESLYNTTLCVCDFQRSE